MDNLELPQNLGRDGWVWSAKLEGEEGAEGVHIQERIGACWPELGGG